MIRKRMFYALLLILILCLNGCSSKKIIAKNCSETQNSGLFVCDPI
jgi:hypothetical protein